MSNAAPSSTTEALGWTEGLQRLVLKDGVHLGLLPAPQLPWALGCVWAVLPDAVMTEPQVNEQLKAALAGPACWAQTDHVELRRWLVDAGWLSRDGYGRAYQRVPASQMRAELQPVAVALASTDVAAWVAQARQQHQEQRAARRQAWQKQA